MQRRFTPRRPWAPLSDAERDALLHIATTGQPWRVPPERWGKPDTASRLFRRWAHAGLWTRLLEALSAPGAPPALRAMECWRCRLARRAMRLPGMEGLALAQRLGLLTALPMVPWLLPAPDLSKAVFRRTDEVLSRLPHERRPHERPPPGLLATLGRLLAIAGGRPVWSKRFAPP